MLWFLYISLDKSTISYQNADARVANTTILYNLKATSAVTSFYNAISDFNLFNTFLVGENTTFLI